MKYNYNSMVAVVCKLEGHKREYLRFCGLFESYLYAEDYIKYFLETLNEGVNAGKFYMIAASLLNDSKYFNDYEVVSGNILIAK